MMRLASVLEVTLPVMELTPHARFSLGALAECARWVLSGQDSPVCAGGCGLERAVVGVPPSTI